jgi:LAO/AO transport system kinase
MEESWKIADEFFRHNTSNGWIEQNRNNQDIDWMKETLNELILSGFYSQKGFDNHMDRMKEAISLQQMSAFEGAEEIYRKFVSNLI